LVVIRLVFFSWLAILAGMTWTTSGNIAGEISSAVLSVVAFLGGVAGTWLTLYQALHDER